MYRYVQLGSIPNQISHSKRYFDDFPMIFPSKNLHSLAISNCPCPMACYEVIPAAWARSNMADVCVEEKRFQWRMEIKRKDDRDIIWHTTNHMMSIFMYFFFWFDWQWDLPNFDWLAWSFLFSKVGGRPHLGQVHALNLPRAGQKHHWTHRMMDVYGASVMSQGCPKQRGRLEHQNAAPFFQDSHFQPKWEERSWVR